MIGEKLWFLLTRDFVLPAFRLYEWSEKHSDDRPSPYVRSQMAKRTAFEFKALDSDVSLVDIIIFSIHKIQVFGMPMR